MQPNRLALMFLLLALPTLQGCSEPPATAPDAAAADANFPTPDAIADTAAQEPIRACDLVTAEEMSVIVGKTVSAEPEERPSNNETTCSYKFAESLSADVTLSVQWERGQAAMSAMGMMGQIEPGIADPYEGLGDQAAAVGPQLWIRTGEDLMILQIFGVDDVPATAKQIFDTAQARM